MTEIKSVFGNLLETSTQKKRRLKLEKKGTIRLQKRNKIDTELSWVMRQSRNNLKRIIVPAKEQNEHGATSQTSSIKSSQISSTVTLEDERLINQNAKNTFHSESSQSTQRITPETISQSKLVDNIDSHDNISLSDPKATDIENATAKRSVSEKFFDIVIKNIPSFPIMGNKRESSAELTDVLSISVKNDLKTIRFPSVTRILTHTMSPESKQALEMWKERMIEKLGQEGFDKYQRGIR